MRKSVTVQCCNFLSSSYGLCPQITMLLYRSYNAAMFVKQLEIVSWTWLKSKPKNSSFLFLQSHCCCLRSLFFCCRYFLDIPHQIAGSQSFVCCCRSVGRVWFIMPMVLFAVKECSLRQSVSVWEITLTIVWNGIFREKASDHNKPFRCSHINEALRVFLPLLWERCTGLV